MMKILMIPTGALDVNTYYAVCEKTKKGFIVDPGGYDQTLTDKIKEDGVSLEYIILTHGHHDHIGGVGQFMKEFPKARLIASKHEKEMLSDPRMNFSNYFGDVMSIAPDIYADDGDKLTIGDLELTFLHTPGHTPGGMCIYVENILFSGDTLFRQSIGRTDFPGSSFVDLEKSLYEKLFVLPDETIVLPGHMEETEIGFEKRNNPFVRYMSNRRS
jgi:glyoxylase-like metal-dependent hydrolase (beta-lactamase superfamily II)